MNRDSQPPCLASRLLEIFAANDVRYSAIGDFAEIYAAIASEQSVSRARLWYWGQVIKSLPSFVFDSIYWSITMFSSNLKIALRNFRKNKLDTLLNINGLSLGLACSILILFHFQDELSYDRFFPKADRIYRVIAHMKEGNQTRHWSTTSPVLAEHLVTHLPEIEQTARLFPMSDIVLSYLPDDERPKQFRESFGFFADQSTIDLFDLQFIKGNPKTALTEVNSIVLTKSTAAKYFADENPIGQSLMIGVEEKDYPLKVTGIIEDLPSNSHLKFNYLASFQTFFNFLDQIGLEHMATSRGWAALYNYVLLKDEISVKSAEQRLPDFTADYFSDVGSAEEVTNWVNFELQPITKIYLHSKLEQEIKSNSDISYVYIFAAIGLLILIIAGVNFVNISMAQALKRLHEVGIRKVLGANREQLVKQIIGEAFLIIGASTVISLLLLEAFLPFYNWLTGKHYFFSDIFNLTNSLIFVGIIFLFAILASLYPALFMTATKPMSSLRGTRDPHSSAARTRKGLVILQFAISTFMIFCTIVIYQQLNYFQNKNLGFEKENLISIQLNNELNELAMKNPQTLKNELLKNRSILAASVVSNNPGDRLSVEHLRIKGGPDPDQRPQFRFIRVDEDYSQTLNFKVIAGKDFSELLPTSSSFLINQKAAKALQLDDPIGRIGYTSFNTEGEIVGIVEDFNFASLHNGIEPLAIEFLPGAHPMRSVLCNYMLVKVNGKDIQSTLEYMENTIAELAPASLFDFTFLDDKLHQLYEAEMRMSNLFKAFAAMAIFISCLGLFGLSSYSAQLRVKEIGVRKVLGASVTHILGLMSKNFVLWILISNLIALPLAWLFMQRWLLDFAYRIEIGFPVFLITIILSVVVAFMTVSYQGLRSAYADPVDSLRYE